MKRRDFLAGMPALLVFIPRRSAGAQAPQAQMNSGAHRPVRLPPKRGAATSLSEEEVKKLELGIACQCSCGKDVYTCRTTDFTCVVSPAMHHDVQSLVDGGHSAEEIMTAFVDVYGEAVRMAPKASGFNTIAYVAPYVAMLAAATLVGAWIVRNLRRREAAVPVAGPSVQATDAELEQIRRAMQDEG